jgi:hypothetical protein
LEAAGKIYNEIFEAGGDVQLEVARFLAARDAETIGPWREAVEKLEDQRDEYKARLAQHEGPL